MFSLAELSMSSGYIFADQIYRSSVLQHINITFPVLCSLNVYNYVKCYIRTKVLNIQQFRGFKA